ncbi:hypothetical protein [Myxococcus sp. RHSTA-1-4]|uniref:hypothetical protein n=1 Tax=Myxococcus sp. RHSTA-1-4 TaxID=2874601 RepID=UPI001CBF7239|nr:hypothetical protein [Myxococcus sp. RHSTA-1-4]MBZ4416888.1 hypothetical protein [Myxococcus sp. RHSTA-1-4]
MKNRLLLLPALLALSACRHIPTREPMPSLEEIRREAPPGGLVRVTLRDKHQPLRASSYLVDVRQDKIVARLDSPTAQQLEAQDAPMKTGSQDSGTFVIATLEMSTECKPAEETEDQTGCPPDPGAWNGDPIGGTGGGGDPTGGDPFRPVLNLAARTFWSISQSGLPYQMKPVQVRVPTQAR